MKVETCHDNSFIDTFSVTIHSFGRITVIKKIKTPTSTKLNQNVILYIKDH